jgi:NhaP-type Na+/H+ or K+/H+ antiporter
MFEIIYYIMTYIMIGVLVTIFFDWFIKRVSDQRFTNRERIAVIIFWPIGILSFIWGFIRDEEDE